MIFVPFLSKVFAVEAISFAQIGIMAGLAFAPTVLIQLIKVIRRIYVMKEYVKKVIRIKKEMEMVL